MSKIDYRGVFWLGAVACAVAAVVMLAPSPSIESPAVERELETGLRLRQLGRRMRPMLGFVVITAMAEAGVAKA